MTMPNGEPGDNGGQQGGEPDGGQQNQQQNQQPEWKPPASPEEFNAVIEKRLAQERRKYRDYDTLKAKAEQYDTLAAASQTEHERALAEAQEQAFSAAMGTVVPRLVRAEFKAAALGKLTTEQLDALLEDADLTRYVDDDGEPDVERIKKKVDAFAPKQTAPSFGQGPRQQPQAPKSMNDVIRSLASKGSVTLSGRDLS